VWAALDELPLHHREVLVLCDLEERADSEVSEMLGVPKGTVKSRLRRARLALRQQVPDLIDLDLDQGTEPELNNAGGAR
jgi:RNA polymerase sigma-70 factor (ECF subfamily)